MKRPNMAGSSYPASYTGRPAGEMELEHRAIMDTQPMVSRCAHCPDWTVEAAAAEARDAFHDHLLAAHPEITPTRRRRGLPGSFGRNVSVWRDEASIAAAMPAVRERLRTSHFDSEAAA